MIKNRNEQFYSSLLSKLRTYETVILDVGRVIVHWKTKHQLEDGQDSTDFRRVASHPLWADFQCGHISKESALSLIGSEIGIAFDTLSELMGLCMESLGVDTEMVSIMERLKNENKTLVCISNIDKESFSFLMQRCEFWNHFDNIYVSALMGMVKPNLSVFEFVLNHGRIDPSQSVYVDDSVANVEAAAEFGIDTLHFDKANLSCDRMQGCRV